MVYKSLDCPDDHEHDHENEVSSEEEFDQQIPMQNDAEEDSTRNVDVHGSRALIKWMVLFLCLWQSVFTIPDTALQIMLAFFVTSLRAIAENVSIAFITALAAAMPASLCMLRKSLGSPAGDFFIEYVLCPACHALYRQDECLVANEDGDKVPKTCSFINHPMRHLRKKCGSPLMKKVHLAGGKFEYRPLHVYAYQPLKTSLQRLLNRPGYAAKMEKWRSRPSCENKLSDVYDGNIWKEFNSAKHDNFLKSKRNYGIMLNFDFFQPYNIPQTHMVYFILPL